MKSQLITAAVALPVVGLALVSLLRSRCQPKTTRAGSVPSQQVSPDPLESWSAAQVRAWVASIGLSTAEAALFEEEGIDGQVLARVADRHLKELGITKTGSRMRILTLRDARVADENGTAADAPGRPSEADSANTARPRAAAAAAQEAPESPSESADGLQSVTNGIRRAFQVLSSNDFSGADVEGKRVMLREVQKSLPGILDQFEALPPQQAEMLKPVITQLLEVVGKLDAATKASAAAAAAASARSMKDDDEEDDAVVDNQRPVAAQDVAAVLMRFKEILTSDIIARAPAEKRDDLIGSIITEIGKLQSTMLPRVPAAQRQPLSEVADALVAFARKLSAASQGPASAQPGAVGERPKATPREPQRASLQFLLTRLRSVFEDAKNPAFIEDPNVAGRVQRVAAMKRDVEGLIEEGSHLSDEERAVVAQVGGNILSLLGKVEAINQMQLRAAPAPAAAAAKPSQAPSAPPRGATGATAHSLAAVSSDLKAVVGVLRSADFESLAPERKGEVVALLLRKLDSIEQQASQLPADESSAAIEAIENVRSLVGTMSRRLPGGGSIAAAPDEPPAAMPSKPSESLGLILGQLKEITQVLDAPAFESATKKQQLDMIGAMQQHLAKLIPVMQQLPRTEVSVAVGAARALSERLQSVGNGIVDALSGGAAADAEPKQQQDEEDEAADEPEDDNEASAGGDSDASQLTKAVLDKLDSIDRALVAPAFRQASLESKYAFIEGIHEALVKLVEIVEALPPGEQRRAMARVSATHDNVREIVASLSSDINAAENDAISALQRARASGSGEGDDDDDRPPLQKDTTEATMVILDKLQKLFAVLNSDVLKGTDPQQRLTVCSGIQRELSSLVSETKALTADQRKQILPLIQRAAETVSKLAGAEDVDGDEDDEEAAAAAANDDPNRAKLFSLSIAFANELEGPNAVSPASLRRGLALLRDIDAASPRTATERTAQSRLEAALKRRIAALQEDDDDGAADAAGSATSAATDDPFRTKILSFTMELQNARIRDARDLSGYMQRLSTLLSSSEEWKQSEEKVELVQRALKVLEERRGELEEEDEDQGENEEGAEEEEAEEQDENAPKSALEKALDDACSRVTPSIFGQPAAASPILKLLEVCVQNRTKLSHTELQAADRLRVKLAENKKAHDAMGAASAAAAPADDSGDAAAVRLLQLVRVVDKPEDVSELSPFIKEYGRLRQIALTPRGKMALDEAQTVIERHLRRLKAEADTLKKAAADESSSSASTQSSPTTTAAPAARGGIVNPLVADIDLLPRIAERLKSEDFLSHCSAFELQCISAILSRLSDSKAVHKSPELNRSVKSAVQLFSRRMENADGATMKQAADVMSPLELTALVSESPSGHPVLRYVFVSPEEAQDDFHVDTELLQRLARSYKETASPTAEDVVAAVGKSEALLVNVKKYRDGSTNKTGMSEVNLVAQFLEELHGFHTTRLADDVSSSVVATTLKAIADRKPKRLLVYFQTPIYNGAPSPHQVIFENGSSVSHEEVLSLVKDAAEHVVLVHDMGLGLECVASRRGQISRHIGVSLTQAAFLVANTSRCWLYDGFATPIIAEMLSTQDVAVFCAEDFINAALSALGAGSHGRYGSFTQDSALAVPFLFNVGSDDADDFEEEDQTSPKEPPRRSS